MPPSRPPRFASGIGGSGSPASTARGASLAINSARALSTSEVTLPNCARPASSEESLELARVAEAAGIDTIVATPHIRGDHAFLLDLIEDRLGTLRAALREAEIAVEVVGGGEVSLTKLTELDDETLASLCIGEGRYLLVESPYTQAPSLLETALFDL